MTDSPKCRGDGDEDVLRGDGDEDVLARHAKAADHTLRMVLAFVAGFAVVVGVGLMLALGGGQAHLAGRLAIALLTLLFLGWLDGLAGRRRAMLAPRSAEYRRFRLWSLVGLGGAAALLLGLAWFLP